MTNFIFSSKHTLELLPVTHLQTLPSTPPLFSPSSFSLSIRRWTDFALKMHFFSNHRFRTETIVLSSYNYHYYHNLKESQRIVNENNYTTYSSFYFFIVLANLCRWKFNVLLLLFFALLLLLCFVLLFVQKMRASFSNLHLLSSSFIFLRQLKNALISTIHGR